METETLAFFGQCEAACSESICSGVTAKVAPSGGHRWHLAAEREHRLSRTEIGCIVYNHIWLAPCAESAVTDCLL